VLGGRSSLRHGESRFSSFFFLSFLLRARVLMNYPLVFTSGLRRTRKHPQGRFVSFLLFPSGSLSTRRAYSLLLPFLSYTFLSLSLRLFRSTSKEIRGQRSLRHLRRRSLGHARSSPRQPVLREMCRSSLLHSHRLPGQLSFSPLMNITTSEDPSLTLVSFPRSLFAGLRTQELASPSQESRIDPHLWRRDLDRYFRPLLLPLSSPSERRADSSSSSSPSLSLFLSSFLG